MFGVKLIMNWSTKAHYLPNNHVMHLEKVSWDGIFFIHSTDFILLQGYVNWKDSTKFATVMPFWTKWCGA